MPAYNVAIPTLPRFYDHQDVTDNVDRKVLVSEQSVALALEQLRGIQIDPELGTAWGGGSYPAPTYVTSGTQSAYEAAIAAAITALGTAATQLAVVDGLRPVQPARP